EGGHVQALAAVRVHQRLQASGAPPGGDHAPAVVKEAPHRGGAEAGGRAGDEDGPGHGGILCRRRWDFRGRRNDSTGHAAVLPSAGLGAGFAALAVPASSCPATAARLRPVADLPRVLALVARCFSSMPSASTTSSDRMPAALAIAIRACARFSSGLACSSSRIASRSARSAL